LRFRRCAGGGGHREQHDQIVVASLLAVLSAPALGRRPIKVVNTRRHFGALVDPAASSEVDTIRIEPGESDFNPIAFIAVYLGRGGREIHPPARRR
jgi:hypothetical protein